MKKITYPRVIGMSIAFNWSSSVIKCNTSSTKIPEVDVLFERYSTLYAQSLLVEGHWFGSHKLLLLQETFLLVDEALGL